MWLPGIYSNLIESRPVLWHALANRLQWNCLASPLENLCVSDFSFGSLPLSYEQARLTGWMLRIMLLSHLYHPSQLACQPPEMWVRLFWPIIHQTTLQLNPYVWWVSSKINRSCPRLAGPLRRHMIPEQ